MGEAESLSSERRRSPRSLRHLPVRVVGDGKDGKPVNELAEAMVVSTHGALIRTSSEFRPGSLISVENPETRQSAQFRVVWAAAKPLEGKWDLGLELSAGRATLWGVDFSAPGMSAP